MLQNTGEYVYEEGIADPAKRNAPLVCVNATSIVSMILTIECIIVDDSFKLKTNLGICLNVRYNNQL
jgi:chaperonin GroEL (HSP60 family)